MSVLKGLEEVANLSTSKFTRTAFSGLTAAKIVAKLAVQKRNLKLIPGLLSDQQRLKNEREIGKMLFAALGQLRGTALKVSQMLSMEVDLLPEGIRQELAKSCYQVPPLNRAVINKVFIRELKGSPSDVFATFETSAFAAASLGQVHRAVTDEGQSVAVKIQYPGISASIRSDMQMIRALLGTLASHTALLPNRQVISDILNEIEERLAEEVDYAREASNTIWFKQQLLALNIVVPSVLTQYSSEKVLTTELLAGVHLEDWLATDPTQEQRNHFGQLIFNVFIESAFKLGRLHADPHPGNYLFLDNGQLAILDFGCVKMFTPALAQQKIQLLNAFLELDQSVRAAGILAVYQRQKIIAKTLGIEEFETALLPLLEPMYQWVSKPFQQPCYDFSNYPSCPKMSIEDAKKANKYLVSVPQHQMYFDRTMLGVFSMLKQMRAQVDTANVWIKVGG